MMRVEHDSENLSGPPWKSEQYFSSLEGMLGLALKAALNTGLWKAVRQPSDQAAVLFLPDFVDKSLRLIACDPFNDTYRTEIGGDPGRYNLEVSFFYPFSFAKEYNKYVDRLSSNGKRKKPETVREFRQRVKEIASTAGILLEYQRIWPFNSIETNCLTFDYSHLEAIAAHERRLMLTFQSMVGVPVLFGDKVLGALLFLSPANREFFSRDPIYWAISKEIGSFVGMGIAAGVYDEIGLYRLYDDAAPIKATEKTENMKTFLNRFKPGFKEKVDLEDLGVEKGDFYVWEREQDLHR